MIVGQRSDAYVRTHGEQSVTIVSPIKNKNKEIMLIAQKILE